MDSRIKLISKLSPTKYPCITNYDEIFKWVKFAPNVDPFAIDPVFLGRYAALCKFLGVIGYVTSGTRSIERQTVLYIADGGYKLPNGEWTGGSGYVAKPGRSLHNYAMAMDESNKVLKALEKNASFAMQKTLAKFGLCKPLTLGNGGGIYEDWHFQPIETINLTVAQRAALAPVKKLDTPVAEVDKRGTLKLKDQGEDVKLLQVKLIKKGFKISADGDFGPKTESAVKDLQRANRLNPDGIVGPKTWAVLG